MYNEITIEDNKLIAKAIIEEENIEEIIYIIILKYFEEKYKMDNDIFKQLQDIMYDSKIGEKIRNIMKEIEEDLKYIPELRKD